MKSLFLSLTLLAIIVLSVGVNFSEQNSTTHTEYLRIHIRADSNEQEAQTVKYKVKDAVVAYLTPFVAQCDTKEKAEKTISENLNGVKSVADKVLSEQGLNYCASVKMATENFPTRSYGEFTLEQGFYDALIIELGSGKGDNWWCVVYPPLCFTGNGVNYVYKSKILEIIRNFAGT